MGEFDDKQVAAALIRLPTMSTKGLKDLLNRTRNIANLAKACEAELDSRPFEFSGDDAARFDQMAKAVGDMSLVEAIRYAFRDAREADQEERTIISWIARNPGTSFKEVLAHYQKGNLGLVIGHLVYHRFGCFRAFVDPKLDQSVIILIKDRSTSSVRYWLRPEAEMVFGELGLT